MGAFAVIMKTDCENRWIVCSTTINTSLFLFVWSMVILVMPSYQKHIFCLVFNHLTFNLLRQPGQQHVPQRHFSQQFLPESQGVECLDMGTSRFV